jgi:hypothetical protein
MVDDRGRRLQGFSPVAPIRASAMTAMGLKPEAADLNQELLLSAVSGHPILIGISTTDDPESAVGSG